MAALLRYLALPIRSAALNSEHQCVLSVELGIIRSVRAVSIQMTVRLTADQIKQPDRPKLADILGPGTHHGRLRRRSQRDSDLFASGRTVWVRARLELLLTYPLMCAIQMISAQVGRVTGKGLAGNMRRHYPALVIYPLIALLLIANVINIGADLGAMAAALRLLVDGPS